VDAYLSKVIVIFFSFYVNILPTNFLFLENHPEDESSKHLDIPLATISEARLYRSNNDKTLSISSAGSSSRTRQHHPSFVSTTPPNTQRQSSIDISSSILSSSTIKDRSSHFSLLEFDSSLSENDRKKFDDIRQYVPDEFDQLLPTLLKLGVVLWPTRFFDSNEQLTNKETKQRRLLITILEKDHYVSQHQHHLHRLYGSVLPHNDILKKNHLLRENLSFQGQLSLLSAYRDEIEAELTKKIQHWRCIPMKAIRTNYIDELNHRSSLMNKHKLHQSYSNIYQLTIDELYSLTLPDKIDQQWQRKSLVKIIEQGMNILDQARKISLSNIGNDCDFQRQDLVRTFKRWLYLWSTLYTEDKCLR
jgi:hypothetical protein